MNICEIHGHTLVPAFFPPTGHALDCGANVGEFATWLANNSGLQVHSFEADPAIYNRIPKHSRILANHCAVAGQNGTLKLAVGQRTCSSVVFREAEDQQIVDVRSVRLEDYCRENGIDQIALLKMDIEGAELDALESCSDAFLLTCSQITVEFHDFIDKSAIPRIEAVLDRLRRLGFWVISFSKFTYGDVLMLNRRQLKLTGGQKIKLLYHKYAQGMRRYVQRKLKR